MPMVLQRKTWYRCFACFVKKTRALFSSINKYGILSMMIGIFGLTSIIGYIVAMQFIFQSSFEIERARQEIEEYSEKVRMLDLRVRERELNIFKDYEEVLQRMERVTSLKYKTPASAVSSLSSLK